MIGTDIETAARLLCNDEPVAIPTETVYGLAANAFSEGAIRHVFALKRRPHSNPLIVHVPSPEAIAPLVTDIPLNAIALLQAFAPGPLTVLLRSNGKLPAMVNGGRSTVAFRIPAHPLALELLRRLPFPLVAPSANLFTTISPTEPAHVTKNFGAALRYVLDGGRCTVGVESTVVGFDRDGCPLLYRPGAIDAAAIARVAGTVRPAPAQEGGAPSPGMLPLHYAPRTPLALLKKDDPLTDDGRTGLLRFRNYHPAIHPNRQFRLSPTGDAAVAARSLYRGLHYLDSLGFDRLFAELLPDTGIGVAINDRIRRAATIFTPEPSTGAHPFITN